MLEKYVKTAVKAMTLCTGPLNHKIKTGQMLLRNLCTAEDRNNRVKGQQEIRQKKKTQKQNKTKQHLFILKHLQTTHLYKTDMLNIQGTQGNVKIKKVCETDQTEYFLKEKT